MITDLTETPLFTLLLKQPESNSKDVELLESAYKKFAETLSSNATSLSVNEFYVQLNFARSELIVLMKSEITDVVFTVYCTKCMLLIDSFIELMKYQLVHGRNTIQDKDTGLSIHKKNELKWTANIADIVELVYALYYSRCINEGEVTLKQLFNKFAEFLSVKIVDPSHSFLRLRERTGERVVFLNRIANKLDVEIKKRD